MEIEEPIQQTQPTTVDQRNQWNGFVDNLNGQPVTEESLAAHADANPGFSITPEMLPQIQQEHQDIRTGDSFGNLNADQLNVARTGMSPDFINQTDQSKSYYPQFKVGSQDFGTDIEGYAASKAGVAPVNTEIDTSKGIAPAPGSVSAPISIAPVAALPPTATRDKSLIPLPDYNDQGSRNKFLQNWQKQYGNLEGRGDTVLKTNEIPRGGSDTIKNIATKAASKYGIDPALLYSSSMEEGASGLFKNKNGTDTKGRNPGEFGYQDYFGDKDFPVNGNQSFGMPDFAKRFPELVQKGYLPKEFANKFRGKDGEFSANDFKTVEDGMQAKAALMKYTYDDVDKYAKQKGIPLTQKARDFFALAEFNSGEGGFHKLLAKYHDKGLLEGDRFLQQRPDTGGAKVEDKDDIYGHVIRRLKMRDNLKEQSIF